ncbi:unnamed protein product [Calicophoron daubneyi]|uniref:Tr-type G domain-containing protein n=1 Tax=Calicophoron daubneyi TaxID=300641 RepID=A0AAV2TBF6_CALDB
MARHRNVRQLGLDDISTYDDALASSVDDDYAISPNTAEMYIYDPSKGNARSRAIFTQEDARRFDFSAEDFPAQEAACGRSSPTHVSGRVVSRTPRSSFGAITRDVTMADLEDRELMVGGSDGPSKLAPASEKTQDNADLSLHPEPPGLAEALSKKLDLSAQSKVASTRSAPTSAVSSSPSKPIDRKLLLNEYLNQRKATGDKEIVNLIVVGHVDAGKSTLMGNLLFQLGGVTGKQIAKYKWEAQKLGKASFAYAWVLDQTTEERNRGVTMDIAQTSFDTSSKRIALMDAPGHKDFVPRVIGGASQADAALLVVNAATGEFETGFGSGGQTREHARLARLLGVSRLIVAVNKMDTVDWDQSRFEAIKSQMSSFLKSLSLSNVLFVPVSGLTGVGLLPRGSGTSQREEDKKAEEKLTSWYKGPCLLDIIDSIPSPDRTVDGPFRFVVSDIFKPAGLGVPAVAGRVLSGGVSAGVNMATSKVFCQPCGLPAAVKSIRSLCNVKGCSENAEGGDSGPGFLDQTVKYAFAGDQVALILNGIDAFQSLAPGDVITDPDNPVPLASRIQAKVLVFSVQQPITRGYSLIFYYHCMSIQAVVSRLKSMTHRENKMEKTVKKPRCLLGNCTADIELTLERPVCLETYDKCKPLGRFMLRVGGESVAGGTVTAVLPPKKNRLLDL